MYTRIDVGPRPQELMGEVWSKKACVLFCKNCLHLENGYGVAYVGAQCPICDYPLVFLDGERWEIKVYQEQCKKERVSIVEQSGSTSYHHSKTEQLTPSDIRKCMEEVDLLISNAGHPGTLDLSGALLAVNPSTGLQKSANGILGLVVKAYDFIPKDEVVLVDPFHADREHMTREELEDHVRSVSALLTGIGEGSHE